MTNAAPLTGAACETATSARHCGRTELSGALRDCRRRTLLIFGALERGLPGLRVPAGSPVNPVVWELGHIGWFHEYWTRRPLQRHRGWDLDPEAPRAPPRRPEADSLYDSMRVPHRARATLPLPTVDQTLGDLERQMDDSLRCLEETPDTDRGLYPFRLALLHEAMHQESLLMTAQALAVPVEDAAWPSRVESPTTAPPPTPRPTPRPGSAWIDIAGGRRRVGWASAGFAFDNELPPHDRTLPSFRIAPRAVRWSQFLPFVESGGYCQREWWTEDGWSWRLRRDLTAPLHLRRHRGQWRQHRFGHWHRLDDDAPAVHLSQHEALAWCAWAGRRLPTEHEWEVAAVEAVDRFDWGEVWEWTASPFAPYPGFRPHPYADYSQPWFDGRPVLKGSSWVHPPFMREARYRNFFVADRNDLFAGFRCCEA